MSAAKRYRWVCPTCGVGVLAGKAPRKDATARYCLLCSAKSPTLVERTCPALDRQREAAEERRRAKSKREREAKARRKTARFMAYKSEVARRESLRADAVGDLAAELERMWPVALRLSPLEAVPRRLPTLNLRSRSGTKSTGTAYYDEHRIVVSVARGDDAEGAQGVLAHEVAHLVAGYERVHSRGFWMVLVDLVREFYGADITIDIIDRETDQYAKQCAIEAAIRQADR